MPVFKGDAILFPRRPELSVYCIRHAEKEPGEYRAPSLPLNDPPLSEEGRRQASRLLEYFENISIASIYVSRYSRTRETIENLSRSKGLHITADERLNEINIGDMEKLRDEEMRNRYPDFWVKYISRKEDFTFPNGESGKEAETRIIEAFKELDCQQNHILVSHDGILRVLICKLLGLPVYKRHLFTLNYCSITCFDFSQDFQCWTLARMNECLH